jgi:hypothetical protein
MADYTKQRNRAEEHRVNLIFEPTKDAAVIDLDVVLNITKLETAAEVRAKIVQLEPGTFVDSLPEGGLAKLPFRFLAHDPPSGKFGVVSRAQESDRKFPVLRDGFAVKNESGGWDLLIRGSSVLSRAWNRAGALDPEQAKILRRELDGLRDGGGETKGADVVGEIADILEDLHEQRDEQGEQRRRVPGACGSRAVVSCTPGGGHGVLCPWASLAPVPTGSGGGGARVRA